MWLLSVFLHFFFSSRRTNTVYMNVHDSAPPQYGARRPVASNVFRNVRKAEPAGRGLFITSWAAGAHLTPPRSSYLPHPYPSAYVYVLYRARSHTNLHACKSPTPVNAEITENVLALY